MIKYNKCIVENDKEYDEIKKTNIFLQTLFVPHRSISYHT